MNIQSFVIKGRCWRTATSAVAGQMSVTPSAYRLREWLAVSKGRHYFSAMIGMLETEQMSHKEKLAPPHWHKKVLEKRLAKIAAGKGQFLTLAQLKSRLTK